MVAALDRMVPYGDGLVAAPNWQRKSCASKATQRRLTLQEFRVSNKNNRLTATIVTKKGYLKRNQKKIDRFVNRVKGSTTPGRIRWVFIEE